MNRHSFVPVLALLVSATAGAAVDPDLLKFVMPEAKVLYGIQVRQTLASPFGQFALSQMPADGPIARFTAATGFELQRDLREILMANASPFGPGQNADALILASGTFATDKFIALATIAGATVSDYHGVATIATQGRGGQVFAFLDSSTIAIGSEDMLHGVIDRRDSATYFSGPLSLKARDASAAGDAWFATVSPFEVSSSSAGGFNPAMLLQSVIESWAGVHFDAGGLTLSAEALTHSPTEAQGLVGMLKLASGMVKGTPAAALQNAQVTASGPVMRVTLTITEEDLERSIPLGARRRAAR